MAKMSTDDLLDQFKEMTLLELSEFIKAFEEAFDVQAAAAAPMMVAGALRRLPGQDVVGASAVLRSGPSRPWRPGPSRPTG